MAYRVAVVGGGVAAVSVIHWLKVLRPLDKITQFSSENLAPSASLKSTAVAALRGTRRGLSELGDELCDMWEWTDQFYSKLNHQGLLSSELETWAYEDKDLKRFDHLSSVDSTFLPSRFRAKKIVREKCWIIDPELFLKNFNQDHEHIKKLVTKLERNQSGWILSTLDSTHEFDVVILCAGVWQRWMQGMVPSSELETLMASQGSYFEWDNIDLGEKSFALSFKGCNIHYRAFTHTLQLGATTIKGTDTFHPNHEALEKIKNHFHECIDLKLDFSKAHIHTGIRSILKTRRPKAFELSPGLFGMNGLYKNGWIYAWPLSKSLVEKL